MAEAVADLVLGVTPQVNDANLVTLNVRPTFSSILRTEESPSKNTAPDLAALELDTGDKVQDSEILVIAELLADGINAAESTKGKM